MSKAVVVVPQCKTEYPLTFTVLSDVEQEIIACLGQFPGIPMLTGEIARGCGYGPQRDMVSIKLYTLVKLGYVAAYETTTGTHAFTVAGEKLRAVKRIGVLFPDF